MSKRLAASIAAVLLSAVPVLAQQAEQPPVIQAPADTATTSGAGKAGCPWSSARTS